MVSVFMRDLHLVTSGSHWLVDEHIGFLGVTAGG